MRQWKSQSREREREEEETNLNQKNQNDSQWKMEPGFQAACMTVHKVDRNLNLLVKIPKFLSQQIESRLLLWDFYDYFFYFVVRRFYFYCILYRDLFLYIFDYNKRTRTFHCLGKNPATKKETKQVEDIICFFFF